MSNEFSIPQNGADTTRQAARQGEIVNPAPSGSAPIGDLKDKVVEDFAVVRDSIKETTDAAVERVKETVSEQTNFAARQVGGIASALEKVGAELEQTDQPDVGRYAKQIGSSVQAFAKRMEGKDIGEVATMAEDFGRKQPLAFLGIAALAGLAASRFMTASSHRTSNTAPDPTPSGSSFINGGKTNG